jgi:hypothetical protein
MQSISPDVKTLCPVCKIGRLSKKISSSLLGLFKKTYVECNHCGAAFLKINEKYRLDEIKDPNYPNWQTYNYQILTVREWNTISQGGCSDQEQKEIDLDLWLQQLYSGTISIPSKMNTNVILNQNEQFVYSIPDVTFSEPRSVRDITGAYGGPTIRITKGLSWRMGGFKARSESHEELRTIDKGNLTITNKRLIFTGTVKNSSIELKKILSIEPYKDGIALNKEGKQRPEYYTNVDHHKISVSNQGRIYEIPMDGIILKVLIEREI